MARLAQSVEHETLNLRVVGSSPTLGEIFLFNSFNKEYHNHMKMKFFNPISLSLVKKLYFVKTFI